jgi:hypothetical protein
MTTSGREATAGSFLAILLSFTVLSAQIGSIKGSFSAGAGKEMIFGD